MMTTRRFSTPTLLRALAALGLCASLGVAAQGSDWYAAWLEALKQNNPTRAAALAREAAGQGDPRGKHALAIMLRDGVGTARDSAEARRLFAEVGNAGNPAARNEYAKMLMQGVGGPVDLEQAHEQLLRASEQNHAESLYTLSSLLLSSQYPKRDEIAAFAAAHKSAVAGYLPAYARVGYLMLRGEGVTKDAERAVEWLKQGSEKGDIQSTAYLGWALVSGTGIGRNTTNGENLLIRAANAGNVWAMGNLTDMYRQGVVLSRDYLRAYTWATIALANGGNTQAMRTMRDELEKQLPPDQVANAQRVAREWSPRSAQSGTQTAQTPPPNTPASTGSAFFVSREGHALTNFHVVRGCKRLTTAANGEATVVFQDANADLAVVRSQTPPASWAKFRPDSPRLGEAVFAFGFPLYGRLSTGGNFTSGVVSSLVGLSNNLTQIQITAPIQPGNSGGPVLDQQGRVVAVAVAVLKSDAAGASVVPQNVNFAVNGAMARSALETTGIRPTLSTSEATLRTDEVAELARQFSTVLQCYK